MGKRVFFGGDLNKDVLKKKKDRSSVLVLSGIILLFSACASQECRSGKAAPPMSESVMNKTITPIEKVKIYKADGSLQCGMGTGISIQEMQKQLKNIQVYSSNTQHDGMMHVAVCGAATGQIHVFEINKKDLEQAKQLGFRQWTID